ASHPLFSRPQPTGGSVFDFRAHFVTLRPWKRTLSASDTGPTLRRAKSDFLSVRGLMPGIGRTVAQWSWRGQPGRKPQEQAMKSWTPTLTFVLVLVATAVVVAQDEGEAGS